MRILSFLLFVSCNSLIAQNISVTYRHLENAYSGNHDFLEGMQSFYSLPIAKDTIHKSIPSEVRFNVREFMKTIEDTLSTNDVYYLFLTDKPIYIGDTTLLLRGLASKYACIVSTFKIRMESNSEEQFKSLVLKTGLHEVGHLLGLKHCENSVKCFMVSSLPNPFNYLNSENKLCSKCSSTIRTYIR